MRAHDSRPRIASTEVRAFAEWMEARGWVCTGVDAKDHTRWEHPCGATHTLPGTPKTYNVRRARVEVLRKEGVDPGTHEGKRRPALRKIKDAIKRERDAERAALQAAERQARLDAVETEARRANELRDLREACEYAQASLRANPADRRAQAYFDHLRQTYRDALAGES
jgi:hypothetical protein